MISDRTGLRLVPLPLFVRLMGCVIRLIVGKLQKEKGRLLIFCQLLTEISLVSSSPTSLHHLVCCLVHILGAFKSQLPTPAWMYTRNTGDQKKKTYYRGLGKPVRRYYLFWHSFISSNVAEITFYGVANARRLQTKSAAQFSLWKNCTHG